MGFSGFLGQIVGTILFRIRCIQEVIIKVEQVCQKWNDNAER